MSVKKHYLLPKRIIKWSSVKRVNHCKTNTINILLLNGCHVRINLFWIEPADREPLIDAIETGARKGKGGTGTPLTN